MVEIFFMNERWKYREHIFIENYLDKKHRYVHLLHIAISLVVHGRYETYWN